MTRPSSGIGTRSDDRLSALLEERGAVPVLSPLTRTLPPDRPGPLRDAVARIREYDWLVVTSARAVPPLVEALRSVGMDVDGFRAADTSHGDGALRAASGPYGERVRVCAVGPATAEALAAVGLPVDLVPERYEAEGVVKALGATGDLSGLRFLLPRAEDGRDLIPRELAASGARVDLVTAYRTVPDAAEAERLAALVEKGEVDALAFTAGSAVRSFARAWGSRGPLPAGIGVVAMGPSTEAALDEAGLPCHETAAPHTLVGLVEALERWAGGRPR